MLIGPTARLLTARLLTARFPWTSIDNQWEVGLGCNLLRRRFGSDLVWPRSVAAPIRSAHLPNTLAPTCHPHPLPLCLFPPDPKTKSFLILTSFPLPKRNPKKLQKNVLPNSAILMLWLRKNKDFEENYGCRKSQNYGGGKVKITEVEKVQTTEVEKV